MKGNLLFLVAFIAFAACASAQVAPPEADAAAKLFKPLDGKANLYIARKSETFGSAVAFKLIVDGNELGPISTGTFYLVAVEPGKHSIEVRALISTAKLGVDLEAGKNYFYDVAATTGSAGKVSVTRVLIEAMGKLMVNQSKLVRAIVP